MASTIQISRTIQYAQSFVQSRILNGVGGNTNEPALSIGDWCRQFILGPPFAWRWNRNILSFTTTPGQQDYTESAPTFGWMEEATINTSGTAYISLNVFLNLPETAVQEQPTRIAARLDSDTGNITFRLFPAPPVAFNVTITYQNSAPTFQTLADTWSPIPDYMTYLYNLGFVAKSYEYANDERYGFTMQLFLRQVIAASEGLSDSQKNLFLDDFLNTVREQQSVGGTAQSARIGRGGFQG